MKTNKVITTLAMMAALGGSSLTTVSAFADTTPDADTNALTTDSSSTTDSSTDSSTTTDSSTKASTTDSSTATTDATTDTSPAADVKETPAADVKETPAPATPATPATPQELPQAGDNTTAFAMGMATFAALISVAMVSMKKKMGFSK